MTSPAPTSTSASDDLRYPIGRMTLPPEFTASTRSQMIQAIADTPAKFAQAVAGFTDAQLDTPYRPGGWTVRQLIHHVADSHINAYMRFKLALTEDTPTIKTYDEAAWAELEDTRRVPPEVSLELLDAIHARWLALLQAMTEADFGRPLMHPERGRLTLDHMLAIYAWHGPHHTAHVTRLKEREGW